MARSSYAYLCFANFVLIGISYIVLNTRIKDAAEKKTLAVNERSRRESNQGTIVIYNRIPKTGSTTLTNAVGYDLCKKNGFSTIHLNMTRNRFMMNAVDQSKFVQNVTLWTERLPALYHGHVAFIDFTRFGLPNPIYINIVREPLERLLSHYYFLRYGDNYRVGLKRSKAGNNETFDQCWTRGRKDCDAKQLWLQIPYFCGTASYCSEVGNRQALQMAKWNAVNRYLLVGLSERMEDFIAVLEQVLPSFFRGALEHFRSLDPKRTHLRNTTKKIAPTEETVAQVKANEVYRMEREFYDFVQAEFEAVWQRTHTEDGDLLPSQYHYEKIKP